MILVVGGTGDLGGRVVRLLREGGHEVRCLVRPATDDSGVLALGATVVRGDLTEPDTLGPACQGVSTVVATATMIARRFAGARRPTIQRGRRGGDGVAGRRCGVRWRGAVRLPLLPRRRLADRDLLGARQAGHREAVAQPRPCARSSSGPTPFRRSTWRPPAGSTWPGARSRSSARATASGGGSAPRMWRPWSRRSPSSRTPHRHRGRRSRGDLQERGGRDRGRIHGTPLKVQHMPRPVARLATRLLDRRKDALASAFGAGLIQDLRPATGTTRRYASEGSSPGRRATSSASRASSASSSSAQEAGTGVAQTLPQRSMSNGRDPRVAGAPLRATRLPTALR